MLTTTPTTLRFSVWLYDGELTLAGSDQPLTLPYSLPRSEELYEGELTLCVIEYDHYEPRTYDHPGWDEQTYRVDPSRVSTLSLGSATTIYLDHGVAESLLDQVQAHC